MKRAATEIRPYDAAILWAMRRTAATVLGVSLLILLPIAGTVSAGSAECQLSVTPTAGPPGTQFVFSGSGYTPTLLTLRQEGKDPIVQELDLGDDDPFRIELVALEEHAGRWTAIASIPDTECAGRAVLRVTLPGTSALTDAAGTERSAILLGMSGLLALFLFAARFFLARPAQRT
jgi:hypothetical protein